MDRGVSGLRACRRNREFRRHRSQTSDASNFASTDGTRARLRQGQIKLEVSCEDFSTSNAQRSTSNAQFKWLSVRFWMLCVDVRRSFVGGHKPRLQAIAANHPLYCTVTNVPIGISEKNLRAASSGNRMQPCEAG